MKYKFNSDKYMTKGIQSGLSVGLQCFLWDRIESLVKANTELDYLQIFTLSKTEDMLSIIHEQEQPVPFKREFHLFDEEIIADEDIETGKVYVIDNIDHVIMLFANEY